MTDHQAVVGQPLTFRLLGSDPDQGTTLTYSAIGLPEGATLDPHTGAFSWTPGPSQTGDYVVAVHGLRRRADRDPAGRPPRDDQPRAAVR